MAVHKKIKSQEPEHIEKIEKLLYQTKNSVQIKIIIHYIRQTSKSSSNDFEVTPYGLDMGGQYVKIKKMNQNLKTN